MFATLHRCNTRCLGQRRTCLCYVNTKFCFMIDWVMYNTRVAHTLSISIFWNVKIIIFTNKALLTIIYIPCSTFGYIRKHKASGFDLLVLQVLATRLSRALQQYNKRVVYCMVYNICEGLLLSETNARLLDLVFCVSLCL